MVPVHLADAHSPPLRNELQQGRVQPSVAGDKSLQQRFGLVKTTGLPSKCETVPPASSMSSTPAQISHSFFGTSVKVASASPVAISAIL